MNPVIGIVTCGFMESRQFVPQTYIDAIEKTGGVPILLPITSDKSICSYYLSICDGFLFCGGDDITPWLYGEELVSKQGRTDVESDIFHLTLMDKVLLKNHPILGICRGMQVLNLALGGSIYQDISLRSDISLNHMQLSSKKSDVCHKVSFTSDSMLYKICGSDIFTNTFHHQCIKNIGQNLHVTGFASDGVVESIESCCHPFAIGIQWHPECMYSFSPSMRRLFSEFVDFCLKSKK